MRNFRGGREFDRQLLSSSYAAAVRLIYLVAGLLFFNFAPQLLGKAVLAEVRRFRSALTATPRVDAVDITAVKVDFPLSFLGKFHLFPSQIFFVLQGLGVTRFCILQLSGM